jgi:hypothetical protein
MVFEQKTWNQDTAACTRERYCHLPASEQNRKKRQVIVFGIEAKENFINYFDFVNYVKHSQLGRIRLALRHSS